MHSALSSWGIFGGVKDSQIREFVQIQRVSYVYELSLRGLLTFGHFGGGRGGGSDPFIISVAGLLRVKECPPRPQTTKILL
jgi:hypothetical protein